MLHVFLSGALAWSLLASFPPPPPLKFTNWPIPQCYYWISKSREGAYITSPFVTLLPSFTLILSFIFLLFNNSLSALWPLIKMNSLCCRLLPPVAVISFSFALYWPSPPSPHLTYSASLHLPWCPLYFPTIPQFILFVPVYPLVFSPFPSPFFSPSISLHLTQQSIMCRALDTGLLSYAFIHQDFEKQKSLSPLLCWPLPLIALSITPGGWSIHKPFPSAPSSSPAPFSHHISPFLLLLLLYTIFLSFFCLALCSPDLCEKTELVSPF